MTGGGFDWYSPGFCDRGLSITSSGDFLPPPASLGRWGSTRWRRLKLAYLPEKKTSAEFRVGLFQKKKQEKNARTFGENQQWLFWNLRWKNPEKMEESLDTPATRRRVDWPTPNQQPGRNPFRWKRFPAGPLLMWRTLEPNRQIVLRSTVTDGFGGFQRLDRKKRKYKKWRERTVVVRI